MCDYVAILVSDIWDEANMHEFVVRYLNAGKDTFSLFEMLSKILSVDKVISPIH